MVHARFDLPFQILSLHVIFAVLTVVASICPPFWVAGTRRRASASGPDQVESVPLGHSGEDLREGAVPRPSSGFTPRQGLPEVNRTKEENSTDADSLRERQRRRRKKGAAPPTNLWRRFLERLADPRPNLVHVIVVVALGILVYLAFAHSIGNVVMPTVESPP